MFKKTSLGRMVGLKPEEKTKMEKQERRTTCMDINMIIKSSIGALTIIIMGIQYSFALKKKYEAVMVTGIMILLSSIIYILMNLKMSAIGMHTIIIFMEIAVICKVKKLKGTTIKWRSIRRKWR
ncbi:MAG: hypothetical protein ACLUR5_03535 [Eubacterium ventriosum]